jgi:PPM family protein phosphatase
MKIAAGNAQHIGARQEQQDSFGFSDPGNEALVSHGGFLGVVADGMGGLSHGSEASHTAVRSFLQTYESKTPNESIPDALARSLSAANQAVVALADRLGSADGTGTTLAAAALHGDSLYWISAGDSRIYLCHGNSLIRVTSDHIYARKLNEEVAKGTISRAEAQGNSERAALTSFLGDLEEVDRSLRPFVLREGDRVLLCSDGFYRALTEAEITEAFRGDPQTACDTLVERAVAKQRKQQDNLTIIALANGSGSPDGGGVLQVAASIFTGLALLGAIANRGICMVLQPLRRRSATRKPASQAAPHGSGTVIMAPPQDPGRDQNPSPETPSNLNLAASTSEALPSHGAAQYGIDLTDNLKQGYLAVSLSRLEPQVLANQAMAEAALSFDNTGRHRERYAAVELSSLA